MDRINRYTEENNLFCIHIEVEKDVMPQALSWIVLTETSRRCVENQPIRAPKGGNQFPWPIAPMISSFCLLSFLILMLQYGLIRLSYI